jgi:hypothetical protein
MLESKRSAQTTDAAPDYRYMRDLHGDHLNAGTRAPCRQKQPGRSCNKPQYLKDQVRIG